MKIKVNGTKQTYRDMYHVLQDIVHACCGDVHEGCGRGSAHPYDPLLILYNGYLIIITKKTLCSKFNSQ